jgi:uncharacterized membrane protein
MHTIIINLISILAIFGFSLAFYLYSKKKAKTKLICPMRSDCDTVIHSDYSRIIGIPVEVLGMLYYGFIGISYTAIFVLNLWSEQIAIILLGISLCAALFSMYLVLIQAFVVKHWCTWCLFSAFTSISIAVLSYIHMTIF